MKILFCIALMGSIAFGNPYPKESEVPKDSPADINRTYSVPDPTPIPKGVEVLRVDIKWLPNETYEVIQVKRELSGTEALLRRSKNQDPLGSFEGRLVNLINEEVVAYNSVGTGVHFRKLTRAVSLRFPVPATPVEFRLFAENRETGKKEVVLKYLIDPTIIPWAIPYAPQELDVRLLQEATQKPDLRVNIYAEGYTSSRKDRFWQDAQKVVSALNANKLPGFSQMTFHAVFHPSNKAIGKATNLGLPVPERDSFLGLYFPYWDDFGRWYHIVYPTREVKYRDGIGLVPYDYPIAVVDDADYWGVGNFKELTAVPARNWSFSYLLMHEIGHYFGLNEEYESGGATELAFAPGISEPWSQNITFLKNPAELKWKQFVSASTPIPTPHSHWSSGRYGAYKGGYAETEPKGVSHKPGKSCVMGSRGDFCKVCQHAIEQRVALDLGTP